MTNVDLGLIFIYWHYMKKANAVSGIHTHAQKSETEAGGQFQLNLYGLKTQQTHIMIPTLPKRFLKCGHLGICLICATKSHTP